MIKNEVLKSVLTNTVFQVLSFFNRFIPKDDKLILIYSNMGMRDNVKAIYDHLIENNYNNKYKILVSCNDEFDNKFPANVKRISNMSGVMYYLKAGHVFYAFGRIPIYPTKGQNVVQMWHGTPFKAPDQHQLKTAPPKPYYTSMLISSEYFKEIVKKAHGLKDENIAICGQPRTDVMFNDFEKYPELKNYKKVIVWLPTFRKSSTLGYSDVDNIKSVIPIFDVSDYENLNDWLSEKNVLLIVKLHPMEDVSKFKELNISNLRLLSHKEFVDKGWDLYKLISQCDAMITDYSSVFYDFMLLNRPLAFTVDDYDDYKNKRGFAVDNPEYLTAGYKIGNKLQFYNFIDDLIKEIDIYREERQEVNKLVNTYNDGKQCERALKIANIKMEVEI